MSLCTVRDSAHIVTRAILLQLRKLTIIIRFIHINIRDHISMRYTTFGNRKCATDTEFRQTPKHSTRVMTIKQFPKTIHAVASIIFRTIHIINWNYAATDRNTIRGNFFVSRTSRRRRNSISFSLRNNFWFWFRLWRQNSLYLAKIIKILYFYGIRCHHSLWITN